MIPMPPRHSIKETIVRAGSKCLRLACAQSYQPVEIGAVSEVVSGGTPDTGNPLFWDGDIVWITPKDLGRSRDIEIQSSERQITTQACNSSSARLLPAGTVLLSSRAPIGHVAIAGCQLCTNQGFKNMVCSENIDNRYLFHMLRASIEDLDGLGRGNTFKEIPAKTVASFSIPLPPISAQRSVAAFLDALYLRQSGCPAELPDLPAQLQGHRRTVVRIEALAAKIEEARGLQEKSDAEIQRLLLSAYSKISSDAPSMTMAEVAPLVRRTIDISLETEYLELGIRSFGNGTFHKAPISGAALGNKRIFRVEAGDLLFNIVFAWEGAVAVAEESDNGRVGSHRFLTCVARQGIATAAYLCFHFLAENGLEDLGKASPGGAGRNRTLGLEALARIKVPVPAFEKQLWFNKLLAKADTLKRLHAETAAELDALLPSILDKAFKGDF